MSSEEAEARIWYQSFTDPDRSAAYALPVPEAKAEYTSFFG